MCIIIAKSKGGRLATIEELKNSFLYNNDGGGYMFEDDGQVHIRKGFMNFEDFLASYNADLLKYDNFNNKSLIIHFRITTAGGTHKENTHPFALCDNYKTMKKTDVLCNVGVAHNGIMKYFTPSKKEEDAYINDTMLFLKTFLHPIYENNKNIFKSNEFLKGLEYITTSKLAILDSQDNLYLSGDFIDEGGLYFSNTSYQPIVYNYKNYNYYDGYDWADWQENENDYKNYSVKLSDNDVVGFFIEDSDEEFTTCIGALRTEDDSEFFYNEYTCELEEINADGVRLALYLDVWVY